MRLPAGRQVLRIKSYFKIVNRKTRVELFRSQYAILKS